MLKATYLKYNFHFINPGLTSRGVMHDRTSWFLIVYDITYPTVKGIGECAPINGLSRDSGADMENILEWICTNINKEDLLLQPDLWNYPSVMFGTETAMLDLKQGGIRLLFNNSFYHKHNGISINGLIWMGSIKAMLEAVENKIKAGYQCLKIKISSINIDNELNMIREVRKLYGWDIEIRVDANGAFTYESSIPVLNKLAELNVHSIEQPLPSSEYESTARLCKFSPVPVALDEDIVHWPHRNEKIKLLDIIKPQYIVLKPGLTGGFAETKQWIDIAESIGIGWWITSALESNIGLNAIAQFSNQWEHSSVQGLGTGELFSNNINSPLYVSNGLLFYDPIKSWDLQILKI